MRRSYRHLSKTPDVPSMPDKFNQIMSNFGLTAVEAVGLTIPDNLSNDPVTKAVYDNILGNIPTKKKDNYSCNLCALEFTSRQILSAHLAGIKHKRKVISEEILKQLARTDPTCGRDRNSGEMRCSLCNVTVTAAHALKKHSLSREHRMNKGEDVTDEPEEIADDRMNGKSDGMSFAPPKKKERAPVHVNVPSYVTKFDDTKVVRFFCNPCQSHCNSDIQLQQHMSCKKHLEKVSGKKKTVTPVPRWKGGLFGRGRGGASSHGGGASSRWDTSLSSSSSLLISTINSNYNQSTYPETSLSNYTDSYGLSSLGRSSASDYSMGKSVGVSTRGGAARGRSEVAGYGRNEVYARPEGVYGRSTPAYGKPEAYPRTAEYSTDYHHGKATDYNQYARQAAAYPNPGYGQSAGRGGVYTYTQPLSHTFVSGGKML